MPADKINKINNMNNFFEKLSPIHTFSETLLLEAIDVYQFTCTEDDPDAIEYKFVVPATEEHRKYVYTVNFDSGAGHKRCDYETTFYYGEDDGNPELYSMENNLGIKHLYSVLATLDAIMLDAAERFPIRDFVITGESTEEEHGNNESAGIRTRMYLRYAERHYPKECCSYDSATGVMRIHAYELPNSRYRAEFMEGDDNVDSEVKSGVILSEGRREIPYNDYSDFRKIKVPGQDVEFNVEIKLNGQELLIQLNPLPRKLEYLNDKTVMEEVFRQLSLLLGNMSTSLGGADYPISSVTLASSAINGDSVDPDTGKTLRYLEHLSDEILFRTGVTFEPVKKNGQLIMKCDTTIANL